MTKRKGSSVVTISLPDELKARVEEYAEKMGLNRSSTINTLISQALIQHKNMEAMRDFVPVLGRLEEQFREAVKKGRLSEDERKSMLNEIDEAEKRFLPSNDE
jgi:predicted transcriptional regulator